MNNNFDKKTLIMYASIGKLITSSLDVNEIIDSVMLEIKQFFNPENWSLLRLDHTTNELYFLFMEGTEITNLEKFRLKPGEGIAGAVASSGKSIFVPDVSIDPRFSNKVDNLLEFKTKSIIAVPVIYRGTIYGVIEIINSEKTRNFSEEEHQILITIAEFTAIALANSTLYQTVIEQSSYDILTGLLNRKKLNKLIAEWKNIEHPIRRFSDKFYEIMIIYIDIDNFKKINDNCGHREGDTALIKISESLTNIFRAEDFLFRIGGDEFLAIVKSYNKDDPEFLTSRISDALNKIKYTPHGTSITATVSHGISIGHINEIENLINIADSRMYNEKFIKKD